MQDRTGQAPITYSRVAIALHWTIAAAILFMIGLGLAMTGPRTAATFAMFQLHKSIGLTILLLTLLRLGWRLLNPPPPLPETLAPIERFAARLAHGGFYVLLLALPLTGWAVASSAKVGVPTRLFGTVPWPEFPGLASLEATGRAAAHEVSEVSHTALAYIAIALVALHVAGALKHQFHDRDTTMGRMLPFGARLLSPLTLAAVAGGLLFLGAGLALPALKGTRAAPDAASKQRLAQDSTAAASPMASELPGPTAASSDAAAQADQAELAAGDKLDEPLSSAWTVDRRNSSIGFSVDWGVQALTGSFAQWAAKIDFDPERLDQASVDVAIDIDTVGTSRSEATEALPGDAWFSAGQFPKARFAARTFRRVAADRYVASGDLTIRDVTRRIELPFRLRIDGDRARMSGTTRIDRVQFGVGQGEWAATDEIARTVQVAIAIAAERER